MLKRPFAADFPLGADGFLGLPIDGKTSVIKALSSMSLSTGTASDRANQFHSIGILTAHEVISIHISGVHGMFCRKQMLLGKGLVDGVGQFHILGGGRSRFHVDEQMGQVLITGFRQVNRCLRSRRWSV